jgi:hypothetical protein
MVIRFILFLHVTERDMTTTNTNDRLEKIVSKARQEVIKYNDLTTAPYGFSGIVRTACQEYAREENQQLRADAEALAVELNSFAIAFDDRSAKEALKQYRSKHPK